MGPPDQRATGHFHNQVLSGSAIHPFAHACFAIFSDQAGRVELGDEVVQVVVGLQDHVAPSAAVASAWTALSDKGLPVKSYTPFPSVPGLGVNLDFVDKHGNFAYREQMATIVMAGNTPRHSSVLISAKDCVATQEKEEGGG